MAVLYQIYRNTTIYGSLSMITEHLRLIGGCALAEEALAEAVLTADKPGLPTLKISCGSRERPHIEPSA